MTFIDVVVVALMLAVSTTAIVTSIAIARSECRTNKELLRVQREQMERMTGDKRD